MCFQSILSCMFLQVFRGATTAHEKGEIQLCAQNRRSGARNEFWLHVSRLKQLPEWIPSREKIPLNVDTAIEIAEKWMKEKGGGSGDISKITISSIHPQQEPFRRHFFYKIDFEVRAFDQ